MKNSIVKQINELKKSKAFTLIELIVVIAVLGILVLLAAPKFLGYTSDAKLSQIKADVKTYETVLAAELVNNDEFAKDWTKIEGSKLQEHRDNGKIFDETGAIKPTYSFGGEYYSIPEDLNLIKTDLKGDFFLGEDGNVYYFDDKAKMKPDKTNSGKDSDGDGLSDKKEAELGTDPNNPDTDDDGLSDGDEVNKYKTNPLMKDTDGDGLNDKEEIDLGTNPNRVDAWDTDGDGIYDSFDLDGDGVVDSWDKNKDGIIDEKNKPEIRFSTAASSKAANGEYVISYDFGLRDESKIVKLRHMDKTNVGWVTLSTPFDSANKINEFRFNRYDDIYKYKEVELANKEFIIGAEDEFGNVTELNVSINADRDVYTKNVEEQEWSLDETPGRRYGDTFVMDSFYKGLPVTSIGVKDLGLLESITLSTELKTIRVGAFNSAFNSTTKTPKSINYFGDNLIEVESTDKWTVGPLWSKQFEYLKQDVVIYGDNEAAIKHLAKELNTKLGYNYFSYEVVSYANSTSSTAKVIAEATLIELSKSLYNYTSKPSVYLGKGTAKVEYGFSRSSNDAPTTWTQLSDISAGKHTLSIPLVRNSANGWREDFILHVKITETNGKATTAYVGTYKFNK